MSTSDYTLRSNEIRHCCNACAVAKVKCTKEKPSCRRCLRRGHACFYAFAMRQGRPRQSSQESRSCQDWLELQTGGTRQQPPWLHVARSVSDANAGTIAHHPINTGFSQVPINIQPADNMDLLPLHTAETSQSDWDPMPNFGGANANLASFAQYDSLLSAQTVLYDNCMSTTGGWTTPNDDEGRHTQCYNDAAPESVPSTQESVLNHHTHDLALPTPVFVNDKLSNPHEPFQSEYQFQGTQTTNTPKLIMDANNIDPWICGCSAKVSSLLEHLTPHGVISVARAGGNPLLCNIDAIISRNEEPLRKVNSILNCPCSFSVSILLHLTAVMLKILGWYTTIIGIVMRCASKFQPIPVDPQDTFLWIGEFFEPYDAGIDSAEQARGYLQLVSSRLEAIRPTMSTLNARLLAPGNRSVLFQPPLGHRIEHATRTLLRAGGLCGTISCKSIAYAFDAELRSRFEGSWQLLVDALHSL